MSYPLVIHSLVVEDDEGMKETYEEIFKTLSADRSLPFPISPPCFAFSYDEALKKLDSSKIFHLVLLDLRLPRSPGIPASDDVELGLELLTRFQHRDTFPVPALLVISGHIGATEQGRLQDTLMRGFFSGRLLAKAQNLELIENEVRSACLRVFDYCRVGIHIRSSDSEQYPTVSPRDEDLLRRSVLAQDGVIGLDLSWWSARRIPAFASHSSGWTKVLVGRCLLSNGWGASRPKFFKLLPGSDAKTVLESTRVFEQKLSHIKVAGTFASKSTALTITEKVGALDARPLSLDQFLLSSTVEQAADVGRQVALQIEKLGDILSESVPLSGLLWAHHSEKRLMEQSERLGSDDRNDLMPIADVLDLLRELSVDTERVRLNKISLVHGDLHIRNVALDCFDNRSDAYIFDPGVAQRGIAGVDLASLEVSILLHVPMQMSDFSALAANLYGLAAKSDESTVDFGSPFLAAIFGLITRLREAAFMWNPTHIYALMVFDAALIQLGGLAFGSSGNMITDERAASLLVRHTGQWYRGLTRISNESSSK